MTLGELHDKLQELAHAEETLARAELALRHGGNADTMRRKHDYVEHARKQVETLRNEELNP